MNTPLVTVLLPVYNAEKYLKRAIDSILNQTYSNFEFLIINDGSTDRSLKIINSYTDNRIKLISNDKNRGLIFSLNLGIDKAEGKYIARMDSDDISFPDRITRQVDFLEKHPDVGILGALIKNKKEFKVFKNKTLSSGELKARVVFHNIFNHPTIMFRTSFLKNNNIYYNSNYIHAEDYNLWLSALSYTEYAILNKELLYYENHEDQVSNVHIDQQIKSIIQSWRDLFIKTGLNFNENEIEIHKSIFYQNYIYTIEFLLACEKWLLKLNSYTNYTPFIEQNNIQKITTVIWFELCTHFSSQGIRTIEIYKKSKLYKPDYISLKFMLYFVIKNMKIKYKLL